MEITAYLHSWPRRGDSWFCEDELCGAGGQPVGRLVEQLEAQCRGRPWTEGSVCLCQEYLPEIQAGCLSHRSASPSSLSPSPSCLGADMSLSLLSVAHVVFILNYFLHISVSFNSLPLSCLFHSKPPDRFLLDSFS